MDNSVGEAVNVGIPVTAMDAGDWRNQLQPDFRMRIVNKLKDTLTKQYPFSGQEGLQEIKEIAIRFEEKMYTVATSQSDYVRKIAKKMLTIETKSQNPLQSNGANSVQNPLQSNGVNTVQNPSQSNGANTVQNPSDEAIDARERRDKVHGDTRYVIIMKIMETFIKHLPSCGVERLAKLTEIAKSLEKEIYMAATSQSDYLSKIATKMLAVETKLQNRLQSNGSNNGQNPSDERSIWHPSSSSELMTLITQGYPNLISS